MKDSLKLALVSGVAGLALIGSFAAAKDGNGDQERLKIKEVGSTLEIHISDNGKVLVRGAKVSAVSGGVITATNTWGSSSMTWTVNTDGNTSFIRKNGGATNIGEVAVDNIISFSGDLVTTSSGLTVQAKTVKDWSIQGNKNAPMTLQGTLKSIAGTAAPTTFVLTVDGTDYTVNVATDTSVLNNLWLHTGLANLHVGDTVRVYGTVDTTAHTINATVVRDTSINI